MDPITAVIILLAAAIVLLGIEMLLPTHGAVGAAGAVAAMGAVAVAFLINRWMGVGLFAICLAATPFVFAGIMRVWDKSRLGKRLRLESTTGPLTHERIEVGDVGRTTTDLRPMGRAEFGPIGVQVIAQLGKINAGTPVRVIDYRDGVASVEALRPQTDRPIATSPQGINS
jgi:membrane-bound ClpP family serine protease